MLYDDVAEVSQQQPSTAQVPLSDQAAVESEAAKWTSPYQEPAFDIPPEQLELMMSTAFKTVVMAFPADRD